ncbi:hypothetical protein U91I_03818 [alpha proteobacterium U9-1i]|nr:hypothetical protein U91I_03818 [alpha proteobacterium U9-1i]
MPRRRFCVWAIVALRRRRYHSALRLLALKVDAGLCFGDYSSPPLVVRVTNPSRALEASSQTGARAVISPGNPKETAVHCI